MRFSVPSLLQRLMFAGLLGLSAATAASAWNPIPLPLQLGRWRAMSRTSETSRFRSARSRLPPVRLKSRSFCVISLQRNASS